MPLPYLIMFAIGATVGVYWRETYRAAKRTALAQIQAAAEVFYAAKQARIHAQLKKAVRQAVAANIAAEKRAGGSLY